MKEDTQVVVSNIDGSKLDSGAYIIDIDVFPSKGYALPCSFKVKRLLNGTLHDLLAHRKRECYYGDYIAVDDLISLMRNRTDVFEEKLFIRVH